MILTLNFIAVDLIECRSASKIDSVSNSPRNYILYVKGNFKKTFPLRMWTLSVGVYF